MNGCLVCLDPVDSADAHPACSRAIFGHPTLPMIDVDLAHLHTLGLAMVGRASISGVQRKISLGVGVDRQTLQVAAAGARYILKPQAGTFPAFPENEHVTMRIAEAFGLVVPRCALLRPRDGSFATIVERFDRPPTGGKLRLEDFCQLAGKSPKQNYDGSAELCVRLTRRFASEPGVAIAALYRTLLFAWWTGNGDMHLKNLSILTGADGRHRLSPAYDQLSTSLVIPGDPLALPLDARKDRLTRANWLHFGAYAALGPAAVNRALELPGRTLHRAEELIARSQLPADMRDSYVTLLRERAAALDEGG